MIQVFIASARGYIARFVANEFSKGGDAKRERKNLAAWGNEVLMKSEDWRTST